jgi:hypothetical protein
MGPNSIDFSAPVFNIIHPRWLVTALHLNRLKVPNGFPYVASA